MPFTSVPSFSAEIPYSNTFNTHCDICSHPISQSDINILQPCFCGPFHGYCITNLELQARDSDPTNPNPYLTCPRCHQTVTAVKYDFLYDHPRASRLPFTAPTQPPHQPILPIAIHDTYPVPPNNTKHLPSHPFYPNPTPAFHPYPTDHTPSAPPAPHDQPSPSLHTNQPSRRHQHHIRSHSSRNPQHSSRPASSFQRTPTSNHSAESSTSYPDKHIRLPSPHDPIPLSPKPPTTQPRNNSPTHHSHWDTDSPDTVLIYRRVSEENVPQPLRGDNPYQAYVEGKATVLRPTQPHNEQEPVTVKVKMDLHVYHHYSPVTKSPPLSRQPTKPNRERERTNVRNCDKTWWKSPMPTSRG